MLSSLLVFDRALWVAIGLAQVILSVVVYRTGLHRRYPKFSLLVHFCSVKTAILMCLPGWLYGWTYFVASYSALLFMGAALGEMYGQVLLPKSLPAWIPRSAVFWLAIAVSLSATLAVIFRPTNGSWRWALLGGTEAGLTSALFFAALILLLYARWLDTAWRPWSARITIGLILWLTVNASTTYLIGLLDENAVVVGRIGQLGHLFAWIWWTAVLWQKEPRVPRNLLEALARVALDQNTANMEASRFITPAHVSGGD